MKVQNKVTGQVIEISKRKSRLRRVQRRVKAWAEVIQPHIDKVGKDNRLVMITLTYADAAAWKPGDMRKFMLDLRHELKSRLLAYAWVAELQQRGAVHYHLILLVKKGTNIPKPDESELWPYGSSRIETARSPWYILSYTGKEYQKAGVFPKGLRMFAVWISPKVVTGVTRWFFRLSAIPQWLSEVIKGADVVGSRFVRVAGGGWECAGTFYKSPWEVLEYG